MTIRPLLPSEAPALTALAARLFRATYAGLIPEGPLEAHVAEAFTPAAQAAELAAPGAAVLVAEARGELVAYAQLRPAPCPVPGTATLEVARFYLDAAHHGTGLATRLMAACAAWGRARGHAGIWLQAWEENPRALRFYAKEGFQDQGATTFAVGELVYRDRVLARPLEAPAAVLFDLDGTLVDSRADLATGVNLTRRDLGLAPLDPAVIATYVGEGVRLLLTRSLPECPERLEEALSLNHGHYCDHLLDQTRLYPGVAEALTRLSGLGYRLGVVTNKPRAFTDLVLTGLGVAPLFSAVVGGGDCPALKPDPAPLRLALEALGGSPGASWMVGDHFTDLEAGRRAGLRRCFCHYGFGEPRGETWELAVDRLGALAEHLALHPAPGCGQL